LLPAPKSHQRVLVKALRARYYRNRYCYLVHQVACFHPMQRLQMTSCRRNTHHSICHLQRLCRIVVWLRQRHHRRVELLRRGANAQLAESYQAERPVFRVCPAFVVPERLLKKQKAKKRQKWAILPGSDNMRYALCVLIEAENVGSARASRIGIFRPRRQFSPVAYNPWNQAIFGVPVQKE